MHGSVIKDMEISRPVEQGELGLFELFSILWRWRIPLAAVVVGCAIAGGVVAKLLPKKFEASVLIAPVTGQQGLGLGGLGSMASELGGLASLAGFSLGAGNSQREIAIATLQSHSLTEEYIQQNDLLPILFNKRWDARRQEWVGKVPTLWLGDRYFAGKVRTVREDSKTGLVMLTIEWTNPKMAATWANGLVALTNQKLRNDAIQESQRAIAYLKGEAQKTNVVELQNAIYSLMKSEIEKEMIARGRQQYALRVVDPAIAPERKSSPITLLWVVGGAVLGFIAVSGVALMQTRKVR